MTTASTQPPAIIWFRQDLRLADNPAFVHAANTAKPVIALYIHDEISPDVRPLGAAQKWWLHHSLESLAHDLDHLGVQLVLRRGAACDIVADFATHTGAMGVFWNRRYGEGEQAVDTQVKTMLKRDGRAAKSFGGLLMHEPIQVRTGKGDPYRVYTPFWRKFRETGEPRKPLDAPSHLMPCLQKLSSDQLDDWNLLPSKPDWSGGLADSWVPGEDGARTRMGDFMPKNLGAYDDMRDVPGADRTSRLSPHLRFGEISPHQLWHAATTRNEGDVSKAVETWCKELVWREFSYHLLQEWPHLATRNFNPRFDKFEWGGDTKHLDAWKQGQTGYPIVDAGMRQLWQTGWMHNRVRMIVGSFLVKHLLIDWREGERWFWDTLVDGDPASNPAQWQWVAGSGADAAPYFRIFNPIMQAQKFDPDGVYIKRHVPELAKLPARYLPAPWDAPEAVLETAGIRLGATYPQPIVDHKQARQRALETFDRSKQTGL